MFARVLAILSILAVFLAGCGGVLSVSYETTATPDLAQLSTVSALEMRIATLEPVVRPLDLNADTISIQEALLNSHRSWRTIWVDALITQAQEEGGSNSERVQLWADRSYGRFRVVSGPAEGTPTSMQIGDGINQERISLPDGKRQTQAMSLSASDATWDPPQQNSDSIEAHPLDLEIDSPLASMLFSTGFAQQGRVYNPVGMEKVAGRPALVVERSSDDKITDRFWIDTRMGIVLRWQSWGKDADRQAPAIDIMVTRLEFDLVFPETLFDLRVSEVPAFASDANASPVATPVPPDTAYVPGAGELYFVLWSPGSNPELQLMRLPGNCVTGEDPCPAPQIVEGFPNSNNTIEPLIWSPQGESALLMHQGILYRYIPPADEWSALLQFPFIYTPVWSPDGQWIALVVQQDDDQQDVYVVRPDGTELQNLTGGQFHGADRHLRVFGWLNDGRVLYAMMDRMSATLHAHRIGEMGASQVMDGTLRGGLVALTSDGLEAAYTSSGDQGVTLWTTTFRDGAFAPDARRLATFNGASISNLLWTEDGAWLVFQVTSGMADLTVETIYAIREDGTDLHQLTQAPVLQNLSLAGSRHVTAEDHDSGRLVVLSIDTGQRKVLEIPGLRLDQQVRGSSWR